MTEEYLCAVGSDITYGRGPLYNGNGDKWFFSMDIQ